jgi:peptide/nickel transport system substrate-binding protein
MRTRSKAGAVLLAFVLLLLTACGGGGSKSSGTGATAGGSTTASGGTLIVGMTAAQLPGLDAGTFESEGWEGERFVGFQLYDGLTRYDLNQDKTGPTVKPSLAESWTASADATTWTFKLRSGVTFHDGTPWNADAAVFGFDRILNKASAFFSEDNAGLISYYTGGIKSYRKVDDMTFEITTNGPYALLPNDLPFLVFPSPTAVQKAGNSSFKEHPVGTGPFKFSQLIQGGSAEFVRNDTYWAGAPKLDKVILRPIPEATARVAALRSGEVNWIEFPAPDDAKTLTGEGFVVATNPYSHIWPWVFDTTKGPLADARVRLALNLAIDRDSMAKDILSGYGTPAYQYVPKPDSAYTASGDTLKYDPTQAKKLLADAGYANGFNLKLAFPTSGSGNMVPTPMNEKLQADLAKVGVKVDLQPVEWSVMVSDWIAGKMTSDADAVNISLGFDPPLSWALYFASDSVFNVGHYTDPAFDQLWTQVKQELDDTKRAELIAKINSDVLMKDQPWLVVVSDLNPRALSKNIQGFVQPKSVWVDLTHITVASGS